MYIITMQRIIMIIVVLALVALAYFMFGFPGKERDPRFVFSEKYRPEQSAYKYGLVDTNPARRVGAFFDTCSPENMGDCKRNDPYKGLPKP
jgi:hypothetical protein